MTGPCTSLIRYMCSQLVHVLEIVFAEKQKGYILVHDHTGVSAVGTYKQCGSVYLLN